jgi:hypothetical protein
MDSKRRNRRGFLKSGAAFAGLAVAGVRPENVSAQTCLAPCVGDSNTMAHHGPFATIMWDYINRGMPARQRGDAQRQRGLLADRLPALQERRHPRNPRS